jgi:polysaccharide biosynthesis protein PslH
MKILWVKTDFLHPTDRGGQIRTLEMLKALHRRHEIHYVTFDDGRNAEGPRRSGEYCTRAYAVRHSVPPRRSLQFAGQLLHGLISELPVSVARYASSRMKRQIEALLRREPFDSLVCDFLFPAPNIPDIGRAVLFQHNVESMIWRRHVQETRNSAKRAYLALQARRMEAFEGKICRAAAHIVAVSDVDREAMQELFGVKRISSVATGVDLEYFTPPPDAPNEADLIFTGSMDWLPNIDAMEWLAAEILPLIHREQADCRLLIAGRRPTPGLQELARREPRIALTGTVPDIRPYVWGSKISVVPLRIGGGTRLKIFEAVAAKVPVVSTSIGAEGLPLEDGKHILIADRPEAFARKCLELLANPEQRCDLAERAWELVAGRYSWQAVIRDFEAALETAPRPN